MKFSESASNRETACLCLSGLALAVLSACGGSGGSEPSDAGGSPPVMSTTMPAPSTSCLDGLVTSNTVGDEDPFYLNSWHLKNTGATQLVSAIDNFGVTGIDANVESVHQAGKGCTGKGVIIAINDSAMEIGHEDLKDNVLAGKSWHFDTNSEDPSPALNQKEGDHGTEVAGIAAARGWNGKGSRGTAPFASLVAYSFGETSANAAYLAFGARVLADASNPVTSRFGKRADDTSIFNYSSANDYAAPRVVISESDSALDLAVQSGTKNLRGGLGAIYFQSAGNEFKAIKKGDLPDGGTLAVNCANTLKADASILGGVLSNLAGMSCGNSNQEPSGRPYFYQVAAIHNSGKASSYSSAGAVNWITGFGGEYGTDEAGIITTDNSGCSSGENNTSTSTQQDWLDAFGDKVSRLIADLFGAKTSKDPMCNYTGTMNGTSSAAPSVSGVAALMLEANPKLTWQDVGYILAKTARKLDDSIASGTSAVTFKRTGATTGWNIEETWVKNAAGFNFQNRYGFGLVDAYAAVKLAANYAAPAGRRVAELSASAGKSAVAAWVDKVGVNSATVEFADPSAITGALRLDLTLTNSTGVDINPGYLQFEIQNVTTGTKSIVMPAFSSWYVGGKKFPIKAQGQLAFRFQTNAFYGEAVKGPYKVSVIDFSGASGAAGNTLDFVPKLTSFSM